MTTLPLADAEGQRAFSGGHFPQLQLPPSVRLEVMPENGSSAAPVTFTEAPIISNEEVAPEHYLMRVEAPGLAVGAPGQFAVIRPSGNAENHPLLPRPMAVYRYFPDEGCAELLYRVVGEGTAAMARRGRGETAEIVGPAGRGFSIPDGTRGILIVGRGIGVCSLTALVDSARSRGIATHALLSGRMPEVVFGADVVSEAGGKSLCVSDSEGTSGIDNARAWIEGVIAGGDIQQAFVCGSNRLIELTAGLTAEDEIEMYVSLEAHMACGIGYCHSCATGAFGDSQESPLVCRDGPVFRCLPAQN